MYDDFKRATKSLEQSFSVWCRKSRLQYLRSIVHVHVDLNLELDLSLNLEELNPRHTQKQQKRTRQARPDLNSAKILQVLHRGGKDVQRSCLFKYDGAQTRLHSLQTIKSLVSALRNKLTINFLLGKDCSSDESSLFQALLVGENVDNVSLCPKFDVRDGFLKYEDKYAASHLDVNYSSILQDINTLESFLKVIAPVFMNNILATKRPASPTKMSKNDTNIDDEDTFDSTSTNECTALFEKKENHLKLEERIATHKGKSETKTTQSWVSHEHTNLTSESDTSTPDNTAESPQPAGVKNEDNLVDTTRETKNSETPVKSSQDACETWELVTQPVDESVEASSVGFGLSSCCQTPTSQHHELHVGENAIAYPTFEEQYGIELETSSNDACDGHDKDIVPDLKGASPAQVQTRGITPSFSLFGRERSCGRSALEKDSFFNTRLAECHQLQQDLSTHRKFMQVIPLDFNLNALNKSSLVEEKKEESNRLGTSVISQTQTHSLKHTSSQPQYPLSVMFDSKTPGPPHSDNTVVAYSTESSLTFPARESACGKGAHRSYVGHNRQADIVGLQGETTGNPGRETNENSKEDDEAHLRGENIKHTGQEKKKGLSPGRNGKGPLRPKLCSNFRRAAYSGIKENASAHLDLGSVCNLNKIRKTEGSSETSRLHRDGDTNTEFEEYLEEVSLLLAEEETRDLVRENYKSATSSSPLHEGLDVKKKKVSASVDSDKAKKGNLMLVIMGSTCVFCGFLWVSPLLWVHTLIVGACILVTIMSLNDISLSNILSTAKVSIAQLVCKFQVQSLRDNDKRKIKELKHKQSDQISYIGAPEDSENWHYIKQFKTTDVSGDTNFMTESVIQIKSTPSYVYCDGIKPTPVDSKPVSPLDPSRQVPGGQEICSLSEKNSHTAPGSVIPSLHCESKPATATVSTPTTDKLMDQDTSCSEQTQPMHTSLAATMTKTPYTSSSTAQTDNTSLNLGSPAAPTLLDTYGLAPDVGHSKVEFVELRPTTAVMTSVGVQTNLGGETLNRPTDKPRRARSEAFKRQQRKFFYIRRRCQMEAMALKNSDQRNNDFLRLLQLSLPKLQEEKRALMAERAGIERQFEDEKRKNRELVSRLTRLNQQFTKGQPQHLPSSIYQPCLHQCAYSPSITTSTATKKDNKGSSAVVSSVALMSSETAGQNQTSMCGKANASINSGFTKLVPQAQPCLVSKQPYTVSAASATQHQLSTLLLTSEANIQNVSTFGDSYTDATLLQYKLPNQKQQQQQQQNQQLQQQHQQQQKHQHHHHQQQQQLQHNHQQQSSNMKEQNSFQQQRLPIFQLFNRGNGQALPNSSTSNMQEKSQQDNH